MSDEPDREPTQSQEPTPQKTQTGDPFVIDFGPAPRVDALIPMIHGLSPIADVKRQMAAFVEREFLIDELAPISPAVFQAVMERIEADTTARLFPNLSAALSTSPTLNLEAVILAFKDARVSLERLNVAARKLGIVLDEVAPRFTIDEPAVRYRQFWPIYGFGVLKPLQPNPGIYLGFSCFEGSGNSHRLNRVRVPRKTKKAITRFQAGYRSFGRHERARLRRAQFLAR